MGKFSRDKGARGERIFRDKAIEAGYMARRIPLSGAQEGYKGDVAFEKDGKSFKAEVKCRKNSFKLLYDKLANEGEEPIGCMLEKDGWNSCIAVLGFNLEKVINYNSSYLRINDGSMDRFYRKVLKLREFLGEEDVLAVKDDRKPFIYIRYL